MLPMKLMRISMFVMLLGLVSACASLPTNFEQAHGEAWPRPEETFLGGFFADPVGDLAGLSRVYLLDDPREAFRARYGATALAERTLDLQYYLWKGDLAGNVLFAQALAAADRGVAVRLLIDDIYHSGRDEVYAAADAHPRIEIRVFNPMGNRGAGRNANFMLNKRKLNHRMHNKIFLVDNALAVLGGRNIGDDYFAIDPKLNFRDLDVLAVGSAAKQAGVAYDMYWNSPWAVPVTALLKKPVAGDALSRLRDELTDVLDQTDAVPYPVPADDEARRKVLAELADDMVWAEADVIVDPLERFSDAAESEFVRLGQAVFDNVEHEIVAQTAYLIPTDESIENLTELTANGIRVRILTNSLMSNNHMTVHSHYRKYRKKLIAAGVELHELRADAELLEHFKKVENRVADSDAGLHTKAFVFDRRYSLIGSYNMDPRSRIWNSEIGLLVDSEEFASRVMAAMEEDFDPANSYRVTLDEDNKLRWTGSGASGPVEWTREPGAGFWRRLSVRLIGWIPIENEL